VFKLKSLYHEAKDLVEIS